MKKAVGTKKQRKAFTLIEVTLFLAITVALFFPLIIGTSTSISRQRYQDAVNDAFSYLQNAYSEVENVVNANTSEGTKRSTCTLAATIAASESNKNGLQSMSVKDLDFARSNCVIYGKIFFFLPTEDSTYSETGKTTHTIVSYDVLGDLIRYNNSDDVRQSNKVNYQSTSETRQELSEDTNDIFSALRAAHADYLACEDGLIVPAGAVGQHTFQWDSSLETISPNHTPFQGALLIVRSPLNGTINSMFINTDNISNSNNIVSAVSAIRENNYNGCNVGSGTTANRASLYDYLNQDNSPSFKTNEQGAASICVASPDMFAYGGGSSSRRNIQVNTAVPASSRDVKLLNQDDGENQCE